MPLDKIAKEIQRIEKEYEKYRKLYQHDHHIDADEQTHLDDLNIQLEHVKNLFRKYKKYTFESASLEDTVDHFIEQLDEENILDDVANVKNISLSTSIGKGVVFYSSYWGGIEVMTPKDRSMSLRFIVKNNELAIHFWPYLLIDVWGPANGYLHDIQFSFKTGQLSFNIKGYFTSSFKSALKEYIEDLINDTLFDRGASEHIFPFDPFKDPNMAEKITVLQDQFIKKFKGSSSDLDLSANMGSASIGSSVQFVKKYEYNFGSGQVVMDKNAVLQANIQFKGGVKTLMEDPTNAKINYVELNCSGVDIYMKDKLQASIERISFHHGGDLRLNRVIIHNEVVNGLKLLEVLAKLAIVVSAATSHNTGPVILNQANIDAVFIDGVAISVIEKRIEAMIIDAINDSLQETAKTYGFDLKNALGIG